MGVRTLPCLVQLGGCLCWGSLREKDEAGTKFSAAQRLWLQPYDRLRFCTFIYIRCKDNTIDLHIFSTSLQIQFKLHLCFEYSWWPFCWDDESAFICVKKKHCFLSVFIQRPSNPYYIPLIASKLFHLQSWANEFEGLSFAETGSLGFYISMYWFATQPFSTLQNYKTLLNTPKISIFCLKQGIATEAKQPNPWFILM